jgi:hypothetical protein
MAFPRINVRDVPHNHENWGKLVKTWATGKNYVRHKITPAAPFPTAPEIPPEFPKPTKFPEFVAQCQAAGVQLFFDDGKDNNDVTGKEPLDFVLVDVKPDTVVVRVPSGDKIQESEDRLMKDGATYPLPDFYDRTYGGDPKPASSVEKATLHAERVGEYTINTCM